MIENPHFSFPFRRGLNGKVAVVEQDAPDHVLSCENVIVRCPIGFRLERPEFGWDFPEFRNVMDLRELASALERWEPRGSVTVGERDLRDLADTATREISIEVES